MRPPKYLMRLFVCCALLAGSLHAEMARKPFTLQEWVAPNLVVTIDDSPSMNEECLPANQCNFRMQVGSVYRPLVHPTIAAIPYEDRREASLGSNFPPLVAVYSYQDDTVEIRKQRSPNFNPSYYNPSVKYRAWGAAYPELAVGTKPNAPFKPTDNDGYNDRTPGLNLRDGETSFQARWCTTFTNNPQTDCSVGRQTFDPAVYYLLKPSKDGSALNHFEKIAINQGDSFTKGRNRDDCVNSICTRVEERNNFAMWYTYHRFAGKYSGDPMLFYPATYATDKVFGMQIHSPDTNAAYYNPQRRYTPWLKSDGTSYPPSDTKKAKYDPNAPDSTSDTLDLTTEKTAKEIFCNSNVRWDCRYQELTFRPAQYWLLNTTNGERAAGTETSHFTRTNITSGTTAIYPTAGNKHKTRTDCASATKCTGDEELKNFANWFTYYRSKLSTAKAAVSQAFNVIPGDVRLGWGVIGQDKVTGSTENTIDGEATGVLKAGVRAFTGTARSNFFENFLKLKTSELVGTPLRRAMIEVGNYYMRADDAGPWGEVPGGDNTTAHKICRRALNLLLTDGVWSLPDENQLTGVKTGHGNQTLATYSLVGQNIDGDNYAWPYKDATANTLADVAMYYWKTNLRSDLNGSVTPPPSEEQEGHTATWPHMVNYIIGFGVKGAITIRSDITDLTKGTKLWPEPKDEISKADDLAHAAFNSGGKFYPTNDPAELKKSLDDIIQSMGEQSGSDAPVVLPSRFISSDYVYVPAYKSKTWAGDLLAYNFDRSTGDRKKKSDGAYDAAAWSAATQLDAISDITTRKIYTLKGAARFEFTQTALNSNDLISTITTDSTKAQELINYLRGDRTKEGAPYRTRASRLGDIVNSTPLLVLDGEDASYDFLPTPPEGESRGNYRDFLAHKKKRKGLVFVGANDGMLHAFNATTGDEVFAYIPKTVLGDLYKLSDTGYVHQYFVDGALVEADVYDKTHTPTASDTGWRNIVVGTGGAGARNIFAIKVPVDSTADANTVKAPGASDILWEINNTDTGLSGLGYVMQKPAVGMMRDGTWVVIAGNGYVDRGGTATLYIVNALTGALIKSMSPTVTGTANNGLGGVRLVLDSQRRITAAYAGDLQGNLWKFDFSDTNTSNWAVAFGGKPLFKAQTSNTKDGVTTVTTQPITVTPGYLSHPQGGNLVVFGTGKLFETTDPSDKSLQSLYAIWDKVPTGDSSAATSTADTVNPSAMVSRSSLVEQTMTAISGPYFSASNNLVNYATKRGWLIDLNMEPTGLRLVFDPQFAVGKAFLQTLSPKGGTVDACASFQGKSVNFVVNAFSGSASSPTFDVNKDGKIDSLDAVDASEKAINAVAFSSTDTSRAVFSQKVGAGVNSGVVTNAIGQKILVGTKNSLRRSWRQIIRRPSPAP